MTDIETVKSSPLTLPDTFKDIPDVLLGYQKLANKLLASVSVLIIEKSRRIGITWGVASEAVLTAASTKAAGGMDVFYIGFNLDMTREFIGTSADWAKKFSYLATTVEEFIFKDIDKDGETKDIQAFRIRFDSGFEINALTSRPRSLRGRQGLVIIDEAAFHDDLKELMKAALAMLMWGGKVLLISTHDGVANQFNQYIQDARAGRNKYKVLRIDLDDALKDGLYKRICLVTGKAWSQAEEDKWREELVGFYGEGADEELFCVPSQSSGTFLATTLIESRMQDVPIVRLSLDKDFIFKPEYERTKFIDDWCAENLKPLLDSLDPNLMHFLGEDFGRSGDLTILWPLYIAQDTKRVTPFVVELRNIPFKHQDQILYYIGDRLPRLMAGAFDARGNGQATAEAAALRYGHGRIFQVMISVAWYREALPKYKAALEDGMMILPKDADVLSDHRLAVIKNGVPQIPETRTTGGDGGKRHGDSLIAGAMAYWASLQSVSEYAYEGVSGHSDRKDNSDDDDDFRLSRSFGNNKGAW